MKKIVRLTESDLIRLVKRVIKESGDDYFEKNYVLRDLYDRLKMILGDPNRKDANKQQLINSILLAKHSKCIGLPESYQKIYCKKNNDENEDEPEYIPKFTDDELQFFYEKGLEYFNDIKQKSENLRTKTKQEYENREKPSNFSYEDNKDIQLQLHDNKYELIFLKAYPENEFNPTENVKLGIGDFEKAKDYLDLSIRFRKQGMDDEKIITMLKSI
jgi:hypothetical protein